MIRNRFNCLLNSIHKQAHYQLEPRAHTLQLTTCTTKQKINSLRLLLLFTRLGFFFANKFHFLFNMFSRAQREWTKKKRTQHNTTRESEIDHNTQSVSFVFAKHFRVSWKNGGVWFEMFKQRNSEALWWRLFWTKFVWKISSDLSLE